MLSKSNQRADRHYRVSVLDCGDERSGVTALALAYSSAPACPIHRCSQSKAVTPQTPSPHSKTLARASQRSRIQVTQPGTGERYHEIIRAFFILVLSRYPLSRGAAIVSADAAERTRRSGRSSDPASATAPITFAPVSADHPLAAIWNDPDFARRLVGSYGFASDAEPRLTPEEQAIYRDKIVPLLRDDPKKAIGPLESLATGGERF